MKTWRWRPGAFLETQPIPEAEIERLIETRRTMTDDLTDWLDHHPDGWLVAGSTGTTVPDILRVVVPALYPAVRRLALVARQLGVEWPIPHTGDAENEREIFKRIMAAIRRDLLLLAEEGDERIQPLAELADVMYRGEPWDQEEVEPCP